MTSAGFRMLKIRPDSMDEGMTRAMDDPRHRTHSEIYTKARMTMMASRTRSIPHYLDFDTPDDRRGKAGRQLGGC